jgi:protocatechuate 3,4-dioxygenase beta subunit
MLGAVAGVTGGAVGGGVVVVDDVDDDDVVVVPLVESPPHAASATPSRIASTSTERLNVPPSPAFAGNRSPDMVGALSKLSAATCDTDHVSGAAGLLDRRTVLRVLGGLGFGALVAACGGGSSGSNAASRSTSTSTGGNTKSSSATSSTTGSTIGAIDSATCVLAPEMTEGPFYLDINKVRSDITEGRPGAPLGLALTVVDASTCAPVSGAAVDIWHTDSSGVYSGVNGNSGTFMRGTQVSGSDGVVSFKTLYPGWYTGRAVHIHVKVHAGGNVVHTGQLFFPDAFTSSVYTRSPYSSRPGPDLTNAQDSIFQDGGKQSTLSPTASGTGYAAAMKLGVHRT